MVQRIYRRREVEQLTGKKRSALYADIAEGKFPRPVKIGARAVGWLESEIADWQASRLAERNGAEAA
jgi:prophage regulatory protein